MGGYKILSSLRRGFWPVHAIPPLCKYPLAGKCLGPNVASSMVSQCLHSGPLIQVHYDYMERPHHVDWPALHTKTQNRKETLPTPHQTTPQPKIEQTQKFNCKTKSVKSINPSSPPCHCEEQSDAAISNLVP